MHQVGMKNDSIEMKKKHRGNERNVSGGNEKKGLKNRGKCDYSSIWKENSIEKRGACCSRLRVGNRCLDP